MRAERQHGYTYLMMLAALVIVGVLAEAATVMQSRLVRVDREAELLFRGLAYREAIRRYYEAGGEHKRYPRNLADLRDDARFGRRRQHIRELYAEPFEAEWILIRAADGGIQGVASASRLRPLKQANFAPSLEVFAGAERYADWWFEYVPPAPAGHGPGSNTP